MKKSILIIFSGILVLLLMMAVVGCAPNQPSVDEAGKGEPGEGESVEKGESVEEVTLLRFNSWSGSEGAWGDICAWPLREVEKRSNNRIKFEEHYFGTLIPAGEEITSVGSGAVEVSLVYLPLVSSRLPLFSVVLSPGFELDTDSYARAWHEVSQMSEIQEEFTRNNLKLLGIQGANAEHIWSNKTIRTLNDLKGLKIRAVGDSAKVMSLLGASVVGFQSAEVYEALERGTIDACFSSFGGADVWKFHEVSKYFIPLDFTPMGFFYVMNLDKWNALPEDIQSVFTDVFDEELIERYTNVYANPRNQNFIDNLFPECGVEVIELSTEDKSKIFETGISIFEEWISEREKEGLPGEKVAREWARIAESYQ